MATINPFVSGQQDAAAGKTWRECKIQKGSKEWIRYMSGFQAGLDARRKAAALAAREAAQKAAEAVEVTQ